MDENDELNSFCSSQLRRNDDYRLWQNIRKLKSANTQAKQADDQLYAKMYNVHGNVGRYDYVVSNDGPIQLLGRWLYRLWRNIFSKQDR